VTFKSILTLFLLALTVRLIYLFFLISDDFNFRLEDQDIYVNLGLSMLERGEFVYNSGGTYVVETARTPLYPTLLAMVWSVVDYSPWAIVFIQSVIDSITCVVIALLVSSVLPRMFLFGGVLSVFNMNMVAASGMILTDSLFLLLFSLFLWITLLYIKERRVSYMVTLAGLLGLSILTRPVAYYLIPILGAVFLWFLIANREPLMRVVSHVTLFFLTTMMLLYPLVDRNQKQFDTIAITSQAGLHLSQYLVPLAIHFSEGVSYAEGVKEVADRINGVKPEQYGSDPIKFDPNNPFEVSRFESKIALDRMVELGLPKIAYAWFIGSSLNLISSGVMVMPWVRALPHRSFYNTPGDNIFDKIITFVSDRESLKYLLVVAVANLVSLLLLFVKLIGAYFLLKQPSKYGGGWVAFFVMGMIAYFLLITGPVIGVKYMLPIEPLLTLLLVIGVNGLNWSQSRIFKKIGL